MLAENENKDEEATHLFISGLDAHLEKNNGVRFVRVKIMRGQGEVFYHDFTEVEGLKNFIEKCKNAIEDLENNVKTYRVNEYITLKLNKHGETDIYVDGRKFNQCKSLAINIPADKIEDYDEVRSIDEAEGLSLKNVHGRYEVELTSEQEFEGHCSNLQAWVENDYNTAILHRNMAFPLLKRLVEAGDPKARRVFKEEIAYRIGSGEGKIIEYLSKRRGYLDTLTEEEMETLEETLPNLFSKLVFKVVRGACPKFHYDVRLNKISRSDLVIGPATKNYVRDLRDMKREGITHFSKTFTLNDLKYKRWTNRFFCFPVIPDAKGKKVAFASEDIKTVLKLLKKYDDLEIYLPKDGTHAIIFLSKQASVIAAVLPRIFQT